MTQTVQENPPAGSAKRTVKIGNYELTGKIGQGGIAEIYKGRQASLDRDVAIKILSSKLTSDQDIVRRFERESLVIARLNHPNIVHVIDKGQAGGRYYFVMDFIDGTSLREVIDSTKIQLQTKLEMIVQVCKALDYAHKNGVIHRDIKPANLIFDQHNRRIRIMDFGVARLVDSHATRTGVVLGSPSYMAPEQLDGGAITGQADLFSLGVSLFQLLTGQLPFRSDSIPGLMHAIATQPHPPLRTIRPDLPPSLGEVLDRALHKVPEERYETAAQMAGALHDCARAIDPGLR
jgi:serine/threonine-protein kinase